MAKILKDYLGGKTDFLQIFGRPGPVHIEIGTGKATFLLNQARSRPNVNFLGIEWANKYYRYAVDRIGRWGIKNVRIIRADAASFLADFVPDSSVECFHIYFPDPWPKKRHHKRRFFNPTNLEQLLRCLTIGGVLRIATDHAEYFQWIMNVLAEQTERVQQVDFLPTTGTDTGEWVGTNFERKYLKDKRPIYTIAVRKI